MKRSPLRNISKSSVALCKARIQALLREIATLRDGGFFFEIEQNLDNAEGIQRKCCGMLLKANRTGRTTTGIYLAVAKVLHDFRIRWDALFTMRESFPWFMGGVLICYAGVLRRRLPRQRGVDHMKTWIVRISLAAVLILAGYLYGHRSAAVVHAQAAVSIPKAYGRFLGGSDVYLLFEDSAGTIRLVQQPSGQLAMTFPRN
jgi:hypothetical protein